MKQLKKIVVVEATVFMVFLLKVKSSKYFERKYHIFGLMLFGLFVKSCLAKYISIT